MYVLVPLVLKFKPSLPTFSRISSGVHVHIFVVIVIVVVVIVVVVVVVIGVVVVVGNDVDGEVECNHEEGKESKR